MTDAAPGAVVVRDATIDDAFAIARVRTRGWQSGYAGIFSAEFLGGLDAEDGGRRLHERMVEHGAAAIPPATANLVAEAGGDVVGWCLLGENRDENLTALRSADPDRLREIYAIYVDPEHWGVGAGRSLMAEALRRTGDAVVTLWVLEANTRARRFYTAAGFAPDGDRELYSTGDQSAWEVRYRREAPPAGPK
ncbi:GCN5-related protein N-acetyltransferase [Beutenbergia cavernae DSM 12333]|uniref:GCN5-related protein N-acetyltransferase n=1 Tax=Beutenbergia cavernae (strain ATCC BAA-8 / DSM 12333 / CCUG 43141 / JCM 11478 / NBRC 16432 / NCIMB 13614 / HKI 0122) TaxID=471853 RepID=C5C3F5_BEUC1|nr:GNAT family N-acetyltransferase [Beutenbergia cavernae]ACQ79854.1 GCN5-related protein N-acetyltransferase [Beutenbergia cavernae DSM 12333]